MDKDDSKVMIVTAGPGFGKSVLSAKVCELYKERGQLAAYHFCDFRNSDFRNPHRILQSLASQMCENVNEFRDKLTEVLHREHSRTSLSDAFRVLLNDPLHALNREEPMLIVVDALDESKTEVKSEFLELISDELPAWIKTLITSRPELKVMKKLSHLNPFEILPDDKRHNVDLEHFLRHRLPDLNQNDLNSLILKCEGSFLYAYFSANELQENYSGIEPNLNDFVTKGISGFYEKQFKRLKIGLKHFQQDTEQSIFKSFVNIVSSSREPLPIKFLFACMGLSSEEFEICETIVSIMSEILPVYNDSLTVYHKSLWDWLTMNGYEDVSHILRNFKSSKPCDLFWRLFQHHASFREMRLTSQDIHDLPEKYERIYLQYLANEHFDFAKNSTDGNRARDILDETNTVWFEEMTRGKNSVLEVVSCGVFDGSSYLSLSPDKNFLVCRYAQTIEVFRLPHLTKVFDLEVNCAPQNCTFSSDSSYFLCNSIRSCVYIREQKEVPLIPHVPEHVRSAFFSSCGTKLFTAEDISNNSENFIISIKVWDIGKKSCLAEFDFHDSFDDDDDVLEYHVGWFSDCNSYILVWRPGNLACEYFHIFSSTKTEKLNRCDHTCLTEENDYQIFSKYSVVDNFYSISNFGISHFHLPTGEIIVISDSHCSDPFIWKGRKCVISSIYSKNCLALEVYDFINKEIIDTFQIDSVPCYASATVFAYLHEKTFFVALNEGHAFVLSFEPSLESFVAPSVKPPHMYLIVFELSPDNLYVAHFYTYCVLTISGVATGKKLQTVVLPHQPKACWWSESYLWVVFKDSVGKFSYHPNQTEPFRNYVEECALNFKELLKFENGVLVIQGENKNTISILKICHEKLSPLPDFPFFDLDSTIKSVAISSDGNGILLYCGKKYQIYEMDSDNTLHLCALGTLDHLVTRVFHFWLVGEKNSRRSLWVTRDCDEFSSDYENGYLISVDHDVICAEVTAADEIGFLGEVRSITLVDSSILVICYDGCVKLRKVSDGKLITSFSLSTFPEFQNGTFFFFAKRNFLILGDATDFECLKIHNIEKYFIN